MVIVWIKPISYMWSRKYDKAFGWQAQRERELGAKFRKNKALTCKDLASVVEWKFKDDEEKKTRSLALVARNEEANVNRISSQALSIPGCEDSYRMNCLTCSKESAQSSPASSSPSSTPNNTAS